MTTLRLSSACAFLAVAVGGWPRRAAVLTNASDVAAVLIDERRPVSDRFDLCGQVPRIDCVRLVIRTPDDIRVTSRPSWWTTGRLLALVGFLTLVIALIVVWNLVLRRIAHMRLADRTRLAIELHDSISQNLSSVSLQPRVVSSGYWRSPRQ